MTLPPRPFVSGGNAAARRANAALRLLLSVALAMAALAWAPRASAYAWMIRHEYSSCTTCHADPSGGGLLTPYGRAQGEVLLRSHYGKDAADAEPGKVADFAFGLIPLPEPVLLGGDYRLAYLHATTTSGGQSSTDSRVIQMQADLEGQVTFGRFRVNGSLGYDHQGAAAADVTTNPENNLVSRVYWAGLDLGEDNQFLLRAGRLNVPYGVRSIEHTLFIHTPALGLAAFGVGDDINSGQQHGVALAYNNGALRGEVMAILGNYQINPDAFRQRGYSAYAEYAPMSQLAIGVSSKITYAKADELIIGHPEIFRHAHGAFGRYTPVKALVLTAEADFLANAVRPSTVATGFAGMLQADLEPWQGLHFGATGEMLNPANPATGATGGNLFGAWGTVWWFFAPHLDLRSDLIWEQYTTTSNTVSVLVQIHAYL